MSKLLTLEEWARRNYETPPSAKTLLRWRANGNIVPAPKKQGRAYYVEEDARFIDWNDLSVSAKAQHG